MLGSRFCTSISGAFARSPRRVYPRSPLLKNGMYGNQRMVYLSTSVNAPIPQKPAENRATKIVHDEIRKSSGTSTQKVETKPAPATTEVCEMECVQQKLTSVGAETSQIITIADVLAAQALNDKARKSIQNYGTWKSISYDVRSMLQIWIRIRIDCLAVYIENRARRCFDDGSQ